MFTSILDTNTSLTFFVGLICLVSAFLIGIIIAVAYMLSGKYSKSYVISLVLLPPTVQIVIMMVNGNLGTGMAVLGAFSLIRFRSVPGSSKDICCIFVSMAAGLATGMGYIGFAITMTAIISAALVIMSKTSFGDKTFTDKELKVTIPEDLDYTEIFDDLFKKYTKKASLEKVKTTNLGSMFELCYMIELKNPAEEKSFIDEIRCRNGNLTVICSRQQLVKDEL